jgi:hypothetical protein
VGINSGLFWQLPEPRVRWGIGSGEGELYSLPQFHPFVVAGLQYAALANQE